MSARSSPLRAAGSISVATAVSRVLGLLRDQVMSYYFGAGIVTDAFVAAFRVPNLLRDLFAEGALSSALVPTLTAERLERGEIAAWHLVNRVVTALILILGALTVVIVIFAPGIIRVYGSGFSPDKTALAIAMTRIMAPFLLFVALAAVAMGVLNTRGKFFLPAVAPASFNVSVILGVVLLYPVLSSRGINPGLALALGATVGGAMQFVVQLPALRRQGFRFRPDLSLSDAGLRRVGGLMLPATFGLAAVQISILVDTTLASRMGDGPITWLQLAFRLMQLPLGLFGVAIATANLAFVSRHAARADATSLKRNVATSIRAAGLLTLPATAGLIALRRPIVAVIFEHGEFTAFDTAQTAAAAACYGLGLYAYSVTKIQVPTFYALGETGLPVKASAMAVAFKIPASFALIALFPVMGLEPFLGLALATSLAAWINFGLLSRGLKRRIGALAPDSVVPTTLKVGGLSIAMGFACRGFHGWLESLVPAGNLFGQILRLGAAIALGLAIVIVGTYLMRIPEATALLRRFGGEGSDRDREG
jgi:putative peptidoglycan lipid II flippase